MCSSDLHFGAAYPELTSGQRAIEQVIRSEEERFDAVLTDGLPRLEEVLDQAAAGSRVVNGDTAFKLYDTYGIPRDFIEDMVEDRKLAFDREGFERAMEGQREKARARSKFKGGAQADTAMVGFEGLPATRFLGYEGTDATARILALASATDDGAPASATTLGAGQTGWVVLDQSPFYLQSGGQVSDTGAIKIGRAHV